MSAYHVNFLKSVITKPLHVLRKDYDTSRHGRKSSTLTPDIPNVIIDGIFDEEFIIDPLSARKKIIHRVFAKSFDAPDYIDIGWVLNDDVDICMLCRKSPFGMFSYKHHCKACGNIFCSDCAQNTAPIKELRGLGSYRVCDMCFYGQEIVDGIPNRPRPKIVPVAANPNPSTTTAQSAVVEESPEERIRKMKMQQQEEFQRNALERMRQNPSLSTSLSTPSPTGGNSPVVSVKASSSHKNAVATNSTTSTSSVSSNNVASKTGNMTSEVACQLLDTDIDVEERRRRMQYFGELKLVTPTPGYVVKTKRSSATKLFVNICSSPAIPLKTEPSSTRIDPQKKLYMLVNTPVEHQNEKDGSYCVLYDIIVHPDELTICALDATGSARARMNNQSMQLLVAAYKEDVAMAPKVLQITANYKGVDANAGNNASSSGSNSVAVRPVVVPAADAFLAVPQLPAVPPPLSNGNSVSNTSNMGSNNTRNSISNRASNLASGNLGSSLNVTTTNLRDRSGSLDVKRLRTSSSSESSTVTRQQHRNSVVQLRGSTILASVGESAALGVDRTLKAMILPRENVTRLFGKNFNFILDAMKSYEVNLKDLVLYPEPGFVIAVMRQRPAKRLYVNVTHHPAVGFVTQQFNNNVLASSGGEGGDEDKPSPSNSGGGAKRRSYVYTLPAGRTDVIPKPLPHVIGNVSDEVEDPFDDLNAQNSFQPSNPTNNISNGNSGGRATVVDVVVPSAVFFAALQDKSGDLREQLAKEILVRISQLHVRLSSDFQLLTHPLYLQTNKLFLQQEELVDVVAPVLNLTEQEKTIYSAAFIGKMFKQGHSVKSWKERLCFIAENKLQYFDLRMNFKGEFNVEDCVANLVDASNGGSNNGPEEGTVLTNKSMGIPGGGFGFQLSNYASGGQFLNCYVLSEYIRDLYQLVLSSRNAYISSMKALIQIPDMKTGWLLKQGHLVKNWKRRFFVLNYGVLSYYEQDNIASRKGTVDAPKGKINLKNANVVVLVCDETSGGGRMTDSQERVSVTDTAGGVLVVQMQNKDEKKEWFEALRRHILYANEFND